MGNQLGTLGRVYGPQNTCFLGDVRSLARYGLPLAKYPIQDIPPKVEPDAYVKNVLYPKTGYRVHSTLLPRHFLKYPTNGGYYWGYWRYAQERNLMMKIWLGGMFVGLMACNAMADSPIHQSWTSTDSWWYGPAHPNMVAMARDRKYMGDMAA